MKHFLLHIFVLFPLLILSQNREQQEAIDSLSYQHFDLSLNRMTDEYIGKKVFKNENELEKIIKKQLDIALQKGDADNAIRLYGLLGKFWELEYEYNKMLKYARMIDSLSLKSASVVSNATYYYLFGVGIYYDGDLKKSDSIFNKASFLFETYNDSLVSGWAGSYHFLASIAEAKEDFIPALTNYQKSIKLSKYQDDKLALLHSKSGVSSLYSRNYLFEQAYKVRNEIISLAKETKDYDIIAIEYLNFALNEKYQGNYSKQLDYLLKAKYYGEMANKDYLRYFAASSLLVYYSQRLEKEKAKEFFAKLKSLYKEINKEKYLDILFYEAKAYYYFVIENYTEAEKWAIKKLTESIDYGEKELIFEGHELLSLIYQSKGDELLQSKHQAQYAIMQNETKEKALKNQLLFYQTLYETEKRDLKIKAQKTDIALLNEKSKVKTQWMIFGGIGLLILFGGIMLQRSYNFAKKKQRLQEAFSQDLINAQEEERLRVARELHDSVGQKLMLLTKKTKTTGDTSMKNLADSTLEELRSISQGLHPATLERLGITSAIVSLVNQVDANTNIFFTNEIENIDALISKETSLHLYRIIQESLNNMVKHSQAKAASVSIEKTSEGIRATIKDNGKGFVFSKKFNNASSLGMKTLLERAKIIKSKIEIHSQPEKGTTIQLIIPV